MSKKIALIWLLAVACCPFAAQSRTPKLEGVEWGLRAGLNLPHYTAAGFETSNRLGWHAGIETKFCFRHFAVGPELQYVRHTFRLNHPTLGDKRIKTNSLDVPLIFSLRVLPVVRFEAGPVFTLLNEAKYTEGDENLPFGATRPTLSYAVGVGARLGSHAFVDLRYYGWFGPKKTTYPTAETRRFDLRSQTFSLTLGVTF